MDKQRSSSTGIFALLLGIISLVLAGWASADPPTRVARLGYSSGTVSFSPAGENDWVLAPMNQPLITGDRLWVDGGARAELQVGSAVVRMSGNTSVTLLNLDDRVTQVQLAQGTMNVRVRSLGTNEVFEVNTPNLAYSIRRPGEYRIEVDPAGDTTTALVRSGQAEVYGDGTAYVINAQQAYRFAGTDLRDHEYFEVPRADEFDRWSSERDRRGAVSARYVSRDVIGYEDLDDHGSWRAAEGYGNVWVPRVAAGWAPYRDGHWAWVDPWGWTWVDDAPWGFAVSHYGRWTNIRGTWGWVPGPIRARPVYAPALVAFVGGRNFQISISTGNVPGVAWFPLGPRDVYRPSYPASRSYFNNVNTSNTTINTTNITNVYNNVNVRNITYINQQVPNAIVAVPHTAFVQSQPVGRAAVRVSHEAIAKAPVTAVAEVTPVHDSVRGAAAPGRRPPPETQKRPVLVKTPPPPAPVPFTAKQSALAAHPGRPLDAAALAAVKPTEPAPAPPVKVVSSPQGAVAPPKKESPARGRPQAPEGTKGVQVQEEQKGSRPSEAKKGPQPQDVQKAPQPTVIVPKPPEASKVQQAPEAQKGAQPSEPKKGPQAREPEKATPPTAIVPKPPEASKVQQAPDAQKGAQPSEPKKGPQAREPEKATPPTVIVPKPPEASKVQQAPDAQKGAQPSEPKKGPQAREPEKATPPTVIVPKPPEVQKAPQPSEAQKRPQRPDAQDAPKSQEVRKSPQPPVSVPRPPDAQKAPLPPEAQKRPQRPEAEEAQKPAVTVPRPPDSQKAIPQKAEAAKSADKRGAKKSDEQLKREEEEKDRKP